jgi:hypothetical protein
VKRRAEPTARIVVAAAPLVEIASLPSGIMRTRSKRSRAPSATLPPLSTSAVTLPLTARCKSVADSFSRSVPSTSSSTLPSTGMVLFLSATPWQRPRIFNRSRFVTTTCISGHVLARLVPRE